jgi:tape measure domain-containing protein
MKFDNAQFEKGVATTMNTLDKLKSSLNFNTVSTGLSGIASMFTAINSASNKVTFSQMASSLESLESRFSTMGIVGMRVIENITDAITNLASKVTSFLSSKIVSGGITRAMNLENAQFQLQGLLNDETKVAAVMQNVNDAVDGTAYSLDSAAKVASQLAASGLEAGDQMFTSLRAVAGVAAMTNSSYDDIGRVFTTVAGQGKVMADQLNQLASRGMNAAATLANYLGVTESEVRTMVSKGEVSFETFAAAMDDAFGEHAKEANTTFTGAISNIGAALARIGAKFISPLIEQGGAAVEMFNSLRLRINEVNASMDPIANAFTNTVNTIAKLIKHYVDVVNFSASLEILTNMVQGLDRRLRFIRVAFYEVFEPFENAAKEASGLTATILKLSKSFNTFSKESKSSYIGETEKIFTAIKNVMEAVSVVLGVLGDRLNYVLQGFGHATRKLQSINAVGTSFGEVILAISQKLLDLANALNKTKIDQESKAYKIATDIFIALCRAVETLKIVFLSIVNVAKIVAEAFSEVFDIKDAETIRYAARMVRNFAKSLTLSDEDSQNLKDTLKGLFTIVKAVWNVFKGLVSVIWPFTDGVSGLTSAFLSVTGSIGRLITGESKASDITGVLKGVFGGLLKVLSTIPECISVIISKIGDFVKGVTGIDLSGIFSGIAGFFSDIGNGLVNFDFKSAFGNVISSISGFMSSVLNSIKKGFSNIKTFFGSIGTSLANFMLSVLDVIKTALSNIKSAFSTAASAIASFIGLMFEAIKTGFGNVKNAIGTAASAIASFIGLMFEAIKTGFGNVKNAIGTAASAIASFMASAFEVVKSGFSSFKEGFSTAIQTVVDFVSSVFDSLSSLGTTKSDGPDKMVENVETSLNPLTVIGSKIKTAFSNIVPAFSKVVEKLTPLCEIMGKILSSTLDLLLSFINMGTSLFNMLKSIFDDITTFFKGAASTASEAGASLSDAFGSLFDSIKEHPDLSLGGGFIATVLALVKEIIAGFADMTKSFKGITGNLNNFAKAIQSWKKESLADVLEKISASILILAIALGILSKLDQGNLSGVIGAISAMFGEVVGILIVLQTYQSSLEDGLDLTLLTSALQKIAISVLLIAIAMSQLADMDSKSLGIATLAIASLMKEMVSLMLVMAAFTKDVKDGSVISQASKSMLVMAAAILLMVKPITKLGEMKPDALRQGLTAVDELFGVITVFTYVVSKLSPDPTMLKNVAVALISMSTAVKAMAKAVGILGAMDSDVLIQGLLGMVGILSAFVLVMTALGIVLKESNPKTLVAASASMILIAIAINALVPAIAILGLMDPENLSYGLGALVAILISVTGALLLLSNIGGKKAIAAATSIAIICGSLNLLIPMIAMLAALKTGKLVKACVAIAALIAIFVVAAKFSEGMMEFALSMLAIGGGMALLGASVLLTAEGFAVLVAAITALAAAWPLIEPVFESMVKAFGEAIPVLIAGAIDGLEVLLDSIIKMAPKIADAAWALLQAFLDTIFGNIANIAQYFLDMIIEVLDIIRDGLYDIASIIIDMAVILLQAIEERTTEIATILAEILMDILIGAIDGVAARVGELIDSLWKLMIATIDGWTAAIDNNGAELIESLINLAKAMWRMAKKAFKTIYDLLPAQGKKIVNKIVKGIKENGHKIWDKIKSFITGIVDKMKDIWEDLKDIGKNIISGIVEGIKALFDDPIGVLGDLGGKIIDVLKDVLGIASPSKEMKKIGRYICEGLTLGIKNNTSGVTDQSKTLGEETYDAIAEPMSAIADLLGSDFDVDPTIRPVLDLSSVQDGAQQLNGLFARQTLDLATTNSQMASLRESRVSSRNDSISKLNSNVESLADAIQNGNFGIPDDAQIVVYSVLDGKTVGTTVAPFVDSVNGATYTKTKRGYVT